MKLITELQELDDSNIIVESNGDEKNYYIEGVFLQAERKNRNGRIYPSQIMENAVRKYENTFIKTSRAMGELGHPKGPQINLERVSHVITDLRRESNDWIGKAKIIKSTPYGAIAKSFIDEGIKLGVSSRGLGSIRRKDSVDYVGEDFYLATIDIVADPSAPSAFVNGIMEGAEWTMDGNVFREQDIEALKKEIEEAYRSKMRKEDKIVRAIESFLLKN